MDFHTKAVALQTPAVNTPSPLWPDLSHFVEGRVIGKRGEKRQKTGQEPYGQEPYGAAKEPVVALSPKY